MIYKHVGCQTSGELLESSEFRKYSINFEELKKRENYKSWNFDTSSNSVDDKCNTVTQEQIQARDNIMNIYQTHLANLIIYGMSVEMNNEYLQLKVKELTKQILQLRKKINRTKKKNLSKIKSDVVNKNDDQQKQPSSETTYTSYASGKLFKHPEDKETWAVEEDRAHNEKLIFELDKKLTLAENFTEVKNVSENESCQQVYVPEEHQHSNEQWNCSTIAEEVKNLAEEIVKNSGYTFIEEYGMYFDHSSGYYYDPNTSLYYDYKTGTYFYFDHESQSYQFYSQVDCQQEKKKKSATQIKELEDGECSDSSSDSENILEESEPQTSCDAPTDVTENPLTTDIAPSLRLMVMNGTEKGYLHMVTLDGGTVGREESNCVCLKDPSVSKVHAEISYRSAGLSDHHYYIKDVGSNNGTFVRGIRLSESRIESDLTELGHGWEICCGGVSLTCHIHPGHLTCNTCEPGLLLDRSLLCTKEEDLTKESKEKKRRRQNKCLRKKYGLEYHDEKPQVNPLYKDRALNRRESVGSDNPYEKTEMASIEINLSKNNKGFKLLEKMGWSEGQGLGLKQDGRMQPVVPAVSCGRAGLGGHLADVYYDDTTNNVPCKVQDVAALLLLSKTSNKTPLISFTPASENGT